MSETAILALVAILGAVFANAIGYFFQSKQRQEDRNQWYNDFFLREAIKRLSTLAEQLVDTHDILFFQSHFTTYKNNQFTNQEFDEKVNRTTILLQRAIALATPYLSDEVTQALTEHDELCGNFVVELACLHTNTSEEYLARGVVDLEATDHKKRTPESRVGAWDDLNKSHHVVLKYVTAALNPPSLRNIAKANW
jgi:hypothetical protein